MTDVFVEADPRGGTKALSFDLGAHALLDPAYDPISFSLDTDPDEATWGQLTSFGRHFIHHVLEKGGDSRTVIYITPPNIMLIWLGDNGDWRTFLPVFADHFAHDFRLDDRLHLLIREDVPMENGWPSLETGHSELDVLIRELNLH